MSYEYESIRRVTYGRDDDEAGIAVFIPVCEKCGRFVKKSETVNVGEGGLADEPNAQCKRCGPTKMLFEGFF